MKSPSKLNNFIPELMNRQIRTEPGEERVAITKGMIVLLSAFLEPRVPDRKTDSFDNGVEWFKNEIKAFIKRETGSDL